MNVANMMKTVGKTLSGAVGAATDAIGTGLGSLDGYVGRTVSEEAGSKIYSKASNVLMDESVQGARRKVAQSLVNSNNSFRLGNAVGGGAEGLLAGAAGGAVIGGVAGGVNDDSTFLEGAAKGALIGGASGAVGGAVSAAVHNNAGLMENASVDAFAVAERISKWGAGMGDGISRTVNNSPVGGMVKPGSVKDIGGIKVGTQFDGQMRMML
jgi:hypothetical protein